MREHLLDRVRDRFEHRAAARMEFILPSNVNHAANLDVA
jgi:hypothetical protein